MFISVSGTTKKDFMERKISDELEDIMEGRKVVVLGGDNGKIVPLYSDENVEDKYKAQVIAPIIAEGDAIGTVIMVSKENDSFGEVEKKLAETAAAFLGKQMEQ